MFACFTLSSQDTNVLIDTGDNRIRSAFRLHGTSNFEDILLAFNDQCTGQRTDRNDRGLKACFRIVQINLGTPGAKSTFKAFQDYKVGDSIGNYFYPALTSTAAGDIGVIFGASRSGKECLFSFSTPLCVTFPFLKRYPSVMEGDTKLILNAPICPVFVPDVLCHLIFHAPFFLGLPPMPFTGTVPATDLPQQDGTQVNPYGNYFGASADATTGREIWLAGEFYMNSPSGPRWHTGIVFEGP